MSGISVRFAISIVLFLASTIGASAQSAVIRGSIHDPSGAVVVGAKVTLSGRTATRSTTSDAAGGYRFSSLASGTYTLAVEAAGFGRYENTSIRVPGNGELDWPVPLSLQSGSQSVVVQGDAETLELAPSVGKTGTMIQDIPQSIMVIGHRLSDAQGDLALQDTVRNSSGVIQGGTDGFGFADRFQIRGLEARIYNDGFTDGDERNGIPHSLNGVERVEILEGSGLGFVWQRASGRDDQPGALHAVTEVGRWSSIPDGIVRTVFGKCISDRADGGGWHELSRRRPFPAQRRIPGAGRIGL